MQPKADIDLESWVAGVDFVPLGASLKGFLMLLESFFEAFDTFSNRGSFPVVIIFPGSDGDAQ